VIVFEGIFSLLDQELREKMSLKIFVDTAADIRFIRRLERDITTRGRDVKMVIKQYIEFVRPMHKKFIEPTKRYAHIIIPHGANKAALEMIVARINVVLNNEGKILTNDYFDEE
jgi:uridine kinase